MSQPTSPHVTVEDDPGGSRFRIHVDGALAGFSMYKDHERSGDVEPGPRSPKQRIFYHTVIEDEFAGQGLASDLTGAALRESIDAGWRIVAVCPYVVSWLRRHHELDASIDPVQEEHVQALR